MYEEIHNALLNVDAAPNMSSGNISTLKPRLRHFLTNTLNNLVKMYPAVEIPNSKTV